MTATVVVGLAIVLGPSALVIALAMRRIFQKTALSEITPQWLEEFSPDRYRCMASLLSSDDFVFLSRQPGFDLSLYRKLRRERLAIFRQYLDRLVLDFGRLHLAARVLAAQNSEDSSEMAAKLFRLQWCFNVALLQTECEFALCRLGIAAVHVQRLIVPLRRLSEDLPAFGFTPQSTPAF